MTCDKNFGSGWADEVAAGCDCHGLVDEGVPGRAEKIDIRICFVCHKRMSGRWRVTPVPQRRGWAGCDVWPSAQVVIVQYLARLHSVNTVCFSIMGKTVIWLYNITEEMAGNARTSRIARGSMEKNEIRVLHTLRRLIWYKRSNLSIDSSASAHANLNRTTCLNNL